MPTTPTHWSDLDDAKLRATYPVEGGRTFIRGKTRGQIQYRVTQLGITKTKPRAYAPGDRVGSWEVVGTAPSDDSDGSSRVLCRCLTCDLEKVIDASHLRNGYTQKCAGCALAKLHRAGYASIRGFRKPLAKHVRRSPAP